MKIIAFLFALTLPFVASGEKTCREKGYRNCEAPCDGTEVICGGSLCRSSAGTHGAVNTRDGDKVCTFSPKVRQSGGPKPVRH